MKTKSDKTMALEARKDRRTRTLCDFRGIARRFMRQCKDLANRLWRSISVVHRQTQFPPMRLPCPI